MLCAISIVLGLTSLRLVSVSLAINGKAAMTVDAVVPTTVPTINLVNGKTSIINIRNDTERSRLINKFKFIYLTLNKPCIFKAFHVLYAQTLCIFPCFFPYKRKQGKLFVIRRRLPYPAALRKYASLPL